MKERSPFRAQKGELRGILSVTRRKIILMAMNGPGVEQRTRKHQHGQCWAAGRPESTGFALCGVGVGPAPHSNPSSSSEWEPHLKEWVSLCTNCHVILINRMPFLNLFLFVCVCV